MNENNSGLNILKEISAKKEEHEFYEAEVKGYIPGKTKFIIIMGTVMSGLGKGIVSSSIGKLLQINGYTVTPIKLEGYLNVDSGTLNPYRHGEVYVLDDGMECDMDLGTYERLLDTTLTGKNFTTNGQIYSSILQLERKGGFLGRDVQYIPHVTGEVKRRLRKLAMDSKADIVLIEVGGTVGDLENSVYIEALRELEYEEGKENVCNVALTFILEPKFLGEQKSKAGQLGLRSLMAMGIHPDVVACRCHNLVTEKVREKISIFSNVPMDRVISVHDVDSIYKIPALMKKANLDQEILSLLKLKPKTDFYLQQKELEKIEYYIKAIDNPKKEITIGITGKYTNIRDSYASIAKALEHSGAATNTKINIKWIETTEIEDGKLDIVDALKDENGNLIKGIIVPGGFGKRGVEGKIACVRFARENNIPYLGLCYGFQMAIIEFGRNVCKLEDAHTTEVSPNCKNPVVDILPEQKKIEGLGGNMRLGGRNIDVKENTITSKLYELDNDAVKNSIKQSKTQVRERFRHRFEFNPEYLEQFEKQGIVFSGKAPQHPIMQILELPEHKFFVGVQYHPEFTSKMLFPNPLFLGFVKACIE
ncbi:CTP synthase (glutamine hydrolyzing) [Candidatus Woesearchaeota archaeon]|jgi:CTP synthase|nr:CTP synthase (glutamine hydrolyzing) [Candidatus Woesearchaeota archaeon]MBT5272010.1 CTP synthase (glutamine hydrolyzing) [Candidatus Woesearchaeota archaeon]MBT6040751.1 CTP synthase (glutamine hydrolyzing) [Candidatus Woesearchaeota archaeon]MBT6336703.1 CTP synthase (glutamine hydrolyzing) [Candidatus Woesearchaeota archaeon]MBT7927336.1 CTP synthase (glutamine hydrolyzing) [Candidatus Woesearchaeota archaeon]